jgi:DNA repair ATPase RecN
MSITSDIRAYADKAAEKAQAQLNDVTGTVSNGANELVSKFTGNVSDLRAQAEKAINLDALKNVVEPYLEQVKGYRATVTERAEALLEQVKSDPRLSKLVETVQDKVVKPVRTLAARGSKPAPKTAPVKPVAAKPAPVKAAAKPAGKPATRKVTAKPAAKKPATKKA